jgi:sugar phosphate isomerase/epimerase
MASPGVALQLFSLREQARADYGGALRAVKAAGYDAVENAFGNGGLTATEVRRLLDELGMRVASSHVASSRLRDALAEEVDFHLQIGCRDLVQAELPRADREDEAAIRRWADELGRIAARCQQLGARLHYHSHAFEFRRFGGVTGLEILLGNEALFWEPDVYWLNYAGEDAATWIGRYAARSRLLHLKDMRADARPADPIAENAKDLAAYGSAALGDGTLDFGPPLEAASHVEWLIVEQDFAQGPMAEELARSREWLRSRGH